MRVTRKAEDKELILKLFYIDKTPESKVKNVIEILNKIAIRQSNHIVKLYEASYDSQRTYLSYFDGNN